MQGYSKSEFLHDVKEADRKHEREIIGDETYKSQIQYYTHVYGDRTKLAKEILRNRNIEKEVLVRGVTYEGE